MLVGDRGTCVDNLTTRVGTWKCNSYESTILSRVQCLNYHATQSTTTFHKQWLSQMYKAVFRRNMYAHFWHILGVYTLACQSVSDVELKITASYCVFRFIGVQFLGRCVMVAWNLLLFCMTWKGLQHRYEFNCCVVLIVLINGTMNALPLLTGQWEDHPAHKQYHLFNV